MSKRELYEVEIPAFLHIVSGLLLEPRDAISSDRHDPDLVLECLDIIERRVRLDHPDRRFHRHGDSWRVLDAQAVEFADKLPADVYKKARAVLRKRRQRHQPGTVLTKYRGDQ